MGSDTYKDGSDRCNRSSVDPSASDQQTTVEPSGVAFHAPGGLDTDVSLCIGAVPSFYCRKSGPNELSLDPNTPEPGFKEYPNRLSFLSELNRDSILEMALEQRRQQMQLRFLRHRERLEQQEAARRDRRLQLEALEQRFLASAAAAAKNNRTGSGNTLDPTMARANRRSPTSAEHASAAVAAAVALLDRLKENQLKVQSVPTNPQEAAIVKAVRLRCARKIPRQNQTGICPIKIRQDCQASSASVDSETSAASFRSCCSERPASVVPSEVNLATKHHVSTFHRSSNAIVSYNDSCDGAKSPASCSGEAMWFSSASLGDCSSPRNGRNLQSGNQSPNQTTRHGAGPVTHMQSRGVQVPEDSQLMETGRAQRLKMAVKSRRVHARIPGEVNLPRRQRGICYEMSSACVQSAISSDPDEMSLHSTKSICYCRCGSEQLCQRASTELSEKTKSIRSATCQAKAFRLPTLLRGSGAEVSKHFPRADRQKAKRFVSSHARLKTQTGGDRCRRLGRGVHEVCRRADKMHLEPQVDPTPHLKHNYKVKEANSATLAEESGDAGQVHHTFSQTMRQRNIGEVDGVVAENHIESSCLSLPSSSAGNTLPGENRNSAPEVHRTNRCRTKQTVPEATDKTVGTLSPLEVSGENSVSPLHRETPLVGGTHDSLGEGSSGHKHVFQSMTSDWNDFGRECVLQKDFILEKGQRYSSCGGELEASVWRDTSRSCDKDSGRHLPVSDRNKVDQPQDLQLLNKGLFQSSNSTDARDGECTSTNLSAKNNGHLWMYSSVPRRFGLTTDVSSSGSDRRSPLRSTSQLCDTDNLNFKSVCVSNESAEKETFFSVDNSMTSVGLHVRAPAHTLAKAEPSGNPTSFQAVSSQAPLPQSTGVPHSELIFRICSLSRRHIKQQRKILRHQESSSEKLVAFKAVEGVGDICEPATNTPSDETSTTQWERRCLALSDLNESSNTAQCIEQNKRILRKLRRALKPLESMRNLHQHTAEVEHYPNNELESGTPVGSLSPS